MKIVKKHECKAIRDKDFVGVEKFNKDDYCKWYLRFNKELNEIMYCTYCGCNLNKKGEQ